MSPDSNQPADISLRGFIQSQPADELLVVGDEVAPKFQLARWLHDHPDRVILFEHVAQTRCRVVGNVAAQRSRIALALGTTQAALVPHIAHALASADDAVLPTSRPAVFEEESVTTPNLAKELAPVVFYPQGERAYLTAGIIAARSKTHGMNYSFHRMMFMGENRLAVRVVPRHLRMILDEGEGKGEVAVLLGVHPAVSVAAACSGPPDLDELSLAGRLAGHPIPVVDLEGLRLPAETEIVLIGRFTGELADEGPFVDITGTLDGVRRQPVLVVDRLLRRPEPLCPVILPGGPEHRLLMGLPQEPRIWNTVQATVPGLRNLVLTTGGCSWLHAVVAIDAATPGQAKNAGFAALAAHPSLKRVVVVDPDVDVNDAEQVEWAIATRCQPDRDLVVVGGARGSSLDPSRDPETQLTAKWIIDATLPLGANPAEFRRVEPPRG